MSKRSRRLRRRRAMRIQLRQFTRFAAALPSVASAVATGMNLFVQQLPKLVTLAGEVVAKYDEYQRTGQPVDSPTAVRAMHPFFAQPRPLPVSVSVYSIVAAVEQMKAGLPAAIEVIGDRVEMTSLGISAMFTEWQGPVSEAVANRDSLPILVFADWCAENGKGQAEMIARRVAAKMGS